MMVWLLTSSPPQHIDNVSEQAFRERGGAEFYRKAVNETRGINAEFCGVFETPEGETQVWVIDTNTRAEAFIQRNNDTDELDWII